MSSKYKKPQELTDADIKNFSLSKLQIRIESSDAIDRNQMQFVIGAFYKDAIVGYVLYSTMDTDKVPTAYIEDVEVYEKLRRQKIATALYNYILKSGDVKRIHTSGNVRTADGDAFRKSFDKTRAK